MDIKNFPISLFSLDSWLLLKMIGSSSRKREE